MQQQQDQDALDKERARGQVLYLPVISGILPEMLSIFQKQNQQSASHTGCKFYLTGSTKKYFF